MREDVAVALFRLFEFYPLTAITSGLAVCIVVTFFVTSSDSASLVVDIITAGGHLNPPVAQRIFWAVMEGLLAATLCSKCGRILPEGTATMQDDTAASGM